MKNGNHVHITIWNECYISGGADWSLIDLIEEWPDPEDSFTIYINKTHEGFRLIADKTSGRATCCSYTSPFELINSVVQARFLQGFFLKLKRPGRLALWPFTVVITFIQYLFLGINQHTCDLLLMNNGGYPGGFSNYLMAFVARMKGVKRCYMIVRNYPVKPVSHSLTMKLIKKISARLFIKIISVSDSLKTTLKEKAGLAENKLVRIYNGIKLENKLAAQDIPELSLHRGVTGRVGIIGGLEERKGHRLLFAAWVEVLKSCPQAKLFVVGSSTSGDKEGLLNLTRQLGIVDAVVWIEFVPNVGKVMEFLDVVVMPSLGFESFGRVIVEAMASKRPVVASCVGGIPEIIEQGSEGYLFANGDRQGLAASIVRLLQSQSLREEMGQRGFEKYERLFRARIMSQAYCDLVKSDN